MPVPLARADFDVVERMNAPTVALEVVKIKTMEVVSRFPINGKSERQIELCLLGLLRNMDTDNFFVREATE